MTSLLSGSSLISGRSGKEMTIFDSPTFEQDFRIHVDEDVGSASISPSGRDVVLASQQGLHIIDLDQPFQPPRHLRHQTPWTPADVQWSPFASRHYWVVSTSNQRALVWNLELSSLQAPIEHTLHAHSRAITDINFSAFNPDLLATCAVDAFVHCWDLRTPSRPVISFSDWFAGATQVKWNRQNSHIVASSHDKHLHIWDDRKGALPLKTIEAHETKIYGVDWNRTNESKVITCSLDRTIKLWDYEYSETEPERVIHTPFPVWRARHTPFGCGVLAMPQRGSNELHMYDRRPDHAAPTNSDLTTKPNYSFTGHQEHVKEFLWRARGYIDDNVDDRDFQLISWGADRELILHRMTDKQTGAVGFHKGMLLEEKWALTRRGAPYKSYRDKPTQLVSPSPQEGTNGPLFASLGYVEPGSSPGMNKAPIPIVGGWADGGSMMTYSGMETRNVESDDKDLITWMKGVRFGKRGSHHGERQRSRGLSVMTDLRHMSIEGLPENLSDEIIHVGDRFTKVKFEEADVGARRVRVSLNGPWAADGKLIFLRLHVELPQDYPEASPPRFHLDRTSVLPEDRFDEIESDLRTIATGYLIHKRGCLEAILSYLLGERDLQTSTDWFALRGRAPEDDEADSSSDEEDGLLGDLGPRDSQTLDMEGSLGSLPGTNANVPLPKACGALWGPDGRLVCFFPPKQEPKSILQRAALAESSRMRSGREIFEGFGKLRTESPDFKGRNRSSKSIEDIDEDDEDDDDLLSSSSSSSSSDGPDILPARFRPPAAWHGGSLRFQKLRAQSTEGSLPTSNGLSRKAMNPTSKTVISLHTLDDVIPSKRALGEEYLIYGDGLTLCSHNAEAALRHGYTGLADVWELVRLILRDDVPLGVLPVPESHDDVYVLARRALVRIRRKDSGLDLSFDEPDEISNPAGTGLVKWGNHPFANPWLIQILFNYFESTVDIQMLAMLSCVFAQPTAERKDDGDLGGSAAMAIPSSMRLPAQSLNYFPSMEVAFEHYRSTISVATSPSQGRTPGTAFGSLESSVLFEQGGSDPQTPFSAGVTPPMMLSRGSTQNSSTMPSLSTSPERHRVSIPGATGSFAAAASVWARPFHLASSPPTRNRLSGEDLASSIPSNNGVTWGRSKTQIYRSDSTIRESYRARGLSEEYDGGSSTEEDEPLILGRPVKITLKNQDLFDNEACAEVSLLDPSLASRMVFYRESYAAMLGSWGLRMQQNEMLKYNGFMASGKRTRPRDRDSQSTLTLGRSHADGADDDGLGPRPLRTCSNAEHVGDMAKFDPKCKKCGCKIRIMPCTICYQPVNGIYKICFACGHAAHLACLQPLLEDLSEDDLVCESGCECECMRNATIEGEELFGYNTDLHIEHHLAKRSADTRSLEQPTYASIVSRRGSITEARRPLGLSQRARQEQVMGGRLRRTRTKSFGR